MWSRFTVITTIIYTNNWEQVQILSVNCLVEVHIDVLLTFNSRTLQNCVFQYKNCQVDICLQLHTQSLLTYPWVCLSVEEMEGLHDVVYFLDEALW